jgi:hypothetical protein
MHQYCLWDDGGGGGVAILKTTTSINMEGALEHAKRCAVLEIAAAQKRPNPRISSHSPYSLFQWLQYTVHVCCQLLHHCTFNWTGTGTNSHEQYMDQLKAYVQEGRNSSFINLRKIRGNWIIYVNLNECLNTIFMHSLNLIKRTKICIPERLYPQQSIADGR